MTNKEKIANLRKEGFSISHATFYRHVKQKLYSKESSIKEIRKILKRIEKQKNVNILDKVRY